MSLRNIINRLKQIKKFNAEEEIISIVNENKNFIEYILQQQMSQGIDGAGEPVKAKYGDFYSDRTIQEKQRHGFGLGRETNYVTNYMTGSFYDSIEFVQQGKSGVFKSGVPYFESIILRSGEDIMRLGKESAELLKKEVIEPQLKIRFERYTNGLQ